MDCMPISSAALTHHPAALGESLLGGNTSLFLPKSPDHLLCSQVLNGITRSTGLHWRPMASNWTHWLLHFQKKFEFLHSFLGLLGPVMLWLQCEGARAVQLSLILPDPGTPEGASVQELPRGLPWSTWGFGPVYGWLDSWWLALPSALLEICQNEWGFCLRRVLQALTHACALFLPHKWVVYVLGGNDS